MKGPSNRSILVIPDDRITAEDIIRAIQRPSSDRIISPVSDTSSSSDKEKSHTINSRWSLVKSVIGIQRRSSSIYTGGAQHSDFQRFCFLILFYFL